MGEAKRKKQERAAWPGSDRYDGTIDLHVLPPVAAIDGARIRELTGDDTIPDTSFEALSLSEDVIGSAEVDIGRSQVFEALVIAPVIVVLDEVPDLRLEITKVRETYATRAEIEKYSHRASPEAIAENDFNLNIPRYVDTFEPEEEIDVAALQKQINMIEAELAEVRGKMTGYLKELGVDV